MAQKGQDLDVVVVGNVGIDTNIYHIDDLAALSNETQFTSNLDNVGQSGGYSARGFAQLGYQTGFIGSIGNDFMGDHIRSQFAADGIHLEGLLLDPLGTNRSVNLMRTDGNRISFYDGRGNNDLIPDLELCRAILKRSHLAHFSIPNWARQLLPIAREEGLTISCDLQDIVDIEDPYRQDFINYADILFFSNVNQPSPAQFMEKILERDPNKILISGMGSEGCALGSKAGIRYYPPYPMDNMVLDTNGAGDSLAVGFISAYCIEKMNLDQAILWGLIAARHACTLKADSSCLLTRQALDAFLSQH